MAPRLGVWSRLSVHAAARSRWRRRAAWRIWRERVKDAPRACQLIGRLLHRSAISRLMGAFRQWNDHYSFMYELHKALGRSVLKQKQELLETQRKLKRSQRVDAQQSNGAGVCTESHFGENATRERGEDRQNGRSPAVGGRHAATSGQDAPRGAISAAGDAPRTPSRRTISTRRGRARAPSGASSTSPRRASVRDATATAPRGKAPPGIHAVDHVRPPGRRRAGTSQVPAPVPRLRLQHRLLVGAVDARHRRRRARRRAPVGVEAQREFGVGLFDGRGPRVPAHPEHVVARRRARDARR